MERLDQVVIGAEIKAYNTLIGSAASGEHKDKQCRVASAHASAHLQPIHSRQVEIQNKKVIFVSVG